MVEKQINTTGKPTQADAHEPFHRPGSVPRETSGRHPYRCRNFQSEISQNVESSSSSIMMLQIMMYHQIPQGESIVRCIHRSRRYRTVCLVASPFRKVSQFGSRQSWFQSMHRKRSHGGVLVTVESTRYYPRKYESWRCHTKDHWIKWEWAFGELETSISAMSVCRSVKSLSVVRSRSYFTSGQMMDTVAAQNSEICQIGILMLRSLCAVKVGKILPKFYQNVWQIRERTWEGPRGSHVVSESTGPSTETIMKQIFE